MFARKGLIVVEKVVAPDEDRLLELALEAGAEDLPDSESSWDIVTEPGTFKAVQHSAGRRRGPGGLGRDHDDPADARPGRGRRGASRCSA